MDIKHRAYAYLVASLLIGSLTPALLTVVTGANMFEFFLLASLLSIPFGLILLFRNSKLSDLLSLISNKKKLFYIALASILIYVPYEYGIAYAEHFVSASLAIVIFRTNPLLMLLFLPIFLRERLSKKQIFALSLAFVGVLIGVSGGNIFNIFGGASANLPVIVFILLMALGYAFANVVIKWQMFDSDILLPVSGIVLSAFFALLFIGSGAKFASLSGADLAMVVYMAVTNIFSFYMYFHALKILKTTFVTNVFLVSSFLTMGWAAALFAEQIKPYYFMIATLVAVGIIIGRSDKRGGSYSPRKFGDKIRDFVIFDVTGAFTSSGDLAIRTVIKDGGRILALKLPERHKDALDDVTSAGSYVNVYTDVHASVANEARFVKELLGAKENDIVVMKAGNMDESDKFFGELSERIEKA